MQPTTMDVQSYLTRVTPLARQEDGLELLAMLEEVTGREPVLWSGNIVGFGSCHYRYQTGNEGSCPILSFAPRKAATTVYLLDGVAAHEEELGRLGPHYTGVGCLYIKDLSAVDVDVLRGILATSMRTATDGGFEGFDVTVTG